MQDFMAAVISVLLIDPLQDAMAERLAAARVPKAVVAEVEACARTATPVVVERVAGDPWWGATTALRVWTGSATPEAVLLEVAPDCRSAVAAARPFLAGDAQGV
jgi:hypothetical protein